MNTQAEYLDGPKLVAWIYEEGVSLEGYEHSYPSLKRRVREWARGATPEVASADSVLCHLGLCLSWIPDDFYLEQPAHAKPPEVMNGRAYPNELRETCLEEIRAGATARATAIKHGITTRTLHNWRRLYG